MEVHPTVLHRWREQLRERGEEAAFAGRCNGQQQEQSRIAELERKAGQQQLLCGSGDAVRGRDMQLRDEIQKIAVQWPAYGSRRIKRLSVLLLLVAFA